MRSASRPLTLSDNTYTGRLPLGEVSQYFSLAYCLEGENPSRPGGAEPLVFGAGTAAACCPGSPAAAALSARGSSMLSLRSPVGTCTWLGLGLGVGLGIGVRG